MNFRHIPALLLMAAATQTFAQTFATFEPDFKSEITINKPEGYNASLFSTEPQVVSNPDATGINQSANCLGAVNVANADWWGNFIELQLATPVTINETNRYLSFMAYRSIQPKTMRIAINGREASDEVFNGSLAADGQWEQIEIDLYGKFNGKAINSIWIIFSCNWSNPRSGWGEATYCFDNIKLAAAPQPNTVIIDSSVKYQSIDGFAASDCWTGNYVGQWEDETRSSVARMLFSQNDDKDGNPEGIGLSMWRVNLGAGTAEQGSASGIEDISRRAECFLDANGTYNWNKSAGQQYFMKQAKDYGCSSFVAFSNSAPVFMTKNGKGYANSGGTCNLKDDKYTDFADYLATVVEHFTSEGYNFSFISPVNEPQYEWKDNNQEGSPWSNANIAKLVRELDAKISDKNLDTKILLSEAGSWKYLYSESGWAAKQIDAFFNQKNSTYIGDLKNMAPVIGGHSYWTFQTNDDIRNVRKAVADKAAEYGLKTYQTEWSLLDKEPSTETGFPASYDKASYMDIALFMAKIIHADLTFANCSSWAYWTAMDVERWSQKNRFFLVHVKPADGDYGTITNSGTAEASPNLWVLGNYSRFVRPGYTRIALTGASSMNQLLGSAYLSPDGAKIVCVYVNTSKSAVEASISLNGKNTPNRVDVYVTKENQNLKHVSSATEFTGNHVFDARSVTTIVYNFEQPDALPLVKTKQIKVFPNNVKCHQTVRIDLPDNATEATTEIVGLDGRVVSHSVLKNQGGFAIQNIPATVPGIYLLKVSACGITHAEKIIVGN